MRFIFPILMIVAGAGLFFAFTNPEYDKIRELKSDQSSYDTALGNSKELQAQRERLSKVFNEIGRDDQEKLKKLLPDNVNNIRLILEIEQLARSHSMQVTNVEYNPVAETGQFATNKSPGDGSIGSFDLQFSTVGRYSEFLKFIGELEKSLRIVDITSISFTSTKDKAGSMDDVYRYDVRLKTYWLKN